MPVPACFYSEPCRAAWLLPLQAGIVRRNGKVRFREKVSYRKEKKCYGLAKHKLLGLVQGSWVRCNGL